LDALTEALLSKPVGPTTVAPRKGKSEEFTRTLEQTGNTLVVEIVDRAGTVTEGTAADYLTEEGLDPSAWEVTGFRKGKWGKSEEFESCRFTYRPRGIETFEQRPDLDELFAQIEVQHGVDIKPTGDHGFLVLLGDMQFGKIDGDGVEGTLRRTIECIDKAAAKLASYRRLYAIGHVHIAWLGDHIEGFVSQGGANVWRTPLTLNEQIRLTRRVMLHALMTFAPLASKVTMAAVPGNHGEAVRFSGKGVTRYDDSHDTESLIAVSDAAALNPEAFGHVEFYVPETDELTVVTEVAGTVIAHAHGHQWRPGKHFDWWEGQAFEPTSLLHRADLMVAGHLHHEFIDTWGPRTFIQPPSMESESTWYRHAKGVTGAPGLIVAVTRDGETNLKEVIR
jgi:hypothetical protein